jgi:formate dehydrogenase subunit delta
MSPEKLVRMANQIATFFDSQPGEDAAERTALHLRDFWDPRMRARLSRAVEAGEAAGLSLTARAAVGRLELAA